MKSVIYYILTVLFSACATNNQNIRENKKCVENLKFKDQFFDHIKNIENQIMDQQDSSFNTSLKFISKYTHVSFEAMANYANIYPIGVFETDKNNWLKWYDENKCNNIK